MVFDLQMVLAGVLLVMYSLAAMAAEQATSNQLHVDRSSTLAVSINGLECPSQPSDSGVNQQLLRATCTLHACARAAVQRSCHLTLVPGSNFTPCDQGLLFISTYVVLEHLNTSNKLTMMDTSTSQPHGVDSLCSRTSGNDEEVTVNSSAVSQKHTEFFCPDHTALHVAVSCTLADLPAADQMSVPVGSQAWSQVEVLRLSDAQALGTATALNSSMSSRGHYGDATVSYGWQHMHAVEPQTRWEIADTHESMTVVELDVNSTELEVAFDKMRRLHKAGSTTKEQGAAHAANMPKSQSASMQGGLHGHETDFKDARIIPHRCGVDWALWLVRAAMVLLLIGLQALPIIVTECTGVNCVVRTWLTSAQRIE